MDKIKALMVRCGIKPELADRLCESIEAHNRTYMEQKDREFEARTEEAKRICLEEVESYKVELARRFQIFCEAKGAAVESSVAKQAAMRESAALSRLNGIVNLLKGIEPNGQPHGDLQAEIQKLKRQNRSLEEERQHAIEVANRQTAMAEKVLARNRLLESRRGGQPVQEGRKPQPQRLDGRRQRQGSSAPVTSRPTLVENQDRRSTRPPVPRGGRQQDGPVTPESIAATMDIDVI